MRYLSNKFLCIDIELSPIKTLLKSDNSFCSPVYTQSTVGLHQIKPEMNCLEWKQMWQPLVSCCKFELLQKGEVSCKIQFHRASE